MQISSKATLIDWTHYIREKTQEYISSDLIGNPGTIVQIVKFLMRGPSKKIGGGTYWEIKSI